MYLPKLESAFKLEIDRINKIENEIKEKPTLNDLKETVKLLKDFGIKIKLEDIPECYNVAALEHWRLSVIQMGKLT